MTDGQPETEWVNQARARGLSGILSAALDVLEPFGVLGAQMLWAAQPALSLFVAPDVLNGVARALEEPGGVERLRQELEGQLPSDKSEGLSEE